MYTPVKINFLRSLFLAILLNITTNIASAQEPIQISCPSDDLLRKMINEDPSFRTKQDRYEESYQNWIENSNRTMNFVSTLPTVIHIFHVDSR